MTCDKRPEYPLYIAPGYSIHPKAHKSEGYSLGITIVEVIGVSESKLKSFKGSSISSNYSKQSDVSNKLKSLLLNTVINQRFMSLDLDSEA